MQYPARWTTWGALGRDPGYPVEPGALYSGSVVQRINAPTGGEMPAFGRALSTEEMHDLGGYILRELVPGPTAAEAD